jgi:hypothetical protein
MDAKDLSGDQFSYSMYTDTARNGMPQNSEQYLHQFGQMTKSGSERDQKTSQQQIFGNFIRHDQRRANQPSSGSQNINYEHYPNGIGGRLHTVNHEDEKTMTLTISPRTARCKYEETPEDNQRRDVDQRDFNQEEPIYT